MQKDLPLHSADSLGDSDERFRLLVDSVKDYAIFMLDPEGRIATWNQGAKHLKGYQPSEIIGRHFSTFYPEEDIRSNKPAWELEEAIKNGRFEDEGWRIRKDGTRFWANVIITPLYNKQGILIGFGKVTRDLTERRAAEVALRETNQDLQRSRGLLDSMIENLPHMVFVKDAKDLRFVRFNRAGEELIGCSREDLLGRNDYDFFPKEQADLFREADREVLSGKKVLDIPEEFIETKDKGQRILHTRKIPIFDTEGKPDYLLGISEDITEWKKAEIARTESLREQAILEERVRGTRRMVFLAEASTALASTLDHRVSLEKLAHLAVPTLADWCTIGVSSGEEGKLERIAIVHRDPKKAPLIEKLKQYPPTLANYKNEITNVIHTHETKVLRNLTEDQLKNLIKDENHLALIHELGCKSFMLVPLVLRGKAYGAITFISADSSRNYDEQDIAIAEELGRRAAIAIEHSLLYQSAQKAIRARDEFLSIASHELKTPITSLKLQIQMARKNTRPEENRLPAPEKLAKMLDVSDTQLNRLTALIDDLLDVTRIESGKLSFHFEPIDLGLLVREIVDRYTDHLISSNCKIQVSADGPHWISGDRFRLEQVLLNLLSNAAKYAPGGPVEVEVRQNGQWVELSCRDHGEGIPQDKLEKIFERFERAVPSRSTSGLGLGLYITREIVRAHGGTIRAESEPGKGSNFIVKFPRIHD